MTTEADSADHNQLPPAAERLQLAGQELHSFVMNEGFESLAALDVLGGRELPTDPRERLETLRGIVEHWDYRDGDERQRVDWAAVAADLSEADKARVETAARTLGMADSSTPEHTQPTYGIVLGGANRAPLDRLGYLVEQTDPGHLFYLGSSRRTTPEERAKAHDYAPFGPWDEFGLGKSAIQHRLDGHMMRAGAFQQSGEDVRAWAEFEYADRQTGQVKTATALSTPYTVTDASGHSHRATTYDNLAGFADYVGLERQPDASVVLATTGLYRPAQHLAAVEALTLGYGVRVETIGHDAAYSGVQRHAGQYLQEIRSAVHAALHLQAALDALAAREA